MDEPLSNLDAGLRVRTRTEIKRLQRELGITAIFVTHDQEEAMVLSDRIAVMRDGRLQQIGPPMEVYREPREPVRRLLHRLAGDELPRRRPRPRQRRAALPLRRPELPSCRSSAVRAATSPAGRRGAAILGIRPTDLTVGAERELALQRRGLPGRADRAGDLRRRRRRRPRDQGGLRPGPGAGRRRAREPRLPGRPRAPVRPRDRAAALDDGEPCDR